MTFGKANELLANRDRKKIANNTYLERLPSGSIGVKLHATYVVVIHADGTYTLNSGGWRTVTTKSRINQFSPAYVYQDDGEWYVNDGGFGNRVAFEDGMRVRPGGVVHAA